MIVELGHFALILAMCLAVTQAFFGIVGAQLNNRDWMAFARPAVAGQFVFTAFAFGCLAYAFLDNDFTVLYVAANSNSALPSFYRFSAVWGAHEGSMLLWLLVLTIWSAAVAGFSRSMPEQFVSRVLGVLGLVSVGFGLFILFTSNPFERLIPPVADGRDLNPLLQDPAFVLHPPMLYFGYVGMAVPFAFAIAAMLEGKLDAAWARWARPWVTSAWVFLTFGIGLGSWWAYYELGWGGWWFWDPVENSSFMPWLAGCALLHSLAVTEKRGLFKSWTLLLAILAFSLSLLGTFIVRSGVLISVHAFASDPKRGIFILSFLMLCIGGALALYAWRAPNFRSSVGFAAISRESFLLINNVLLVTALFVVFIGTLAPLFFDFFGLPKISVGPPYFNPMFMLPMLPLVFVMAIGMHAGWKRADLSSVKKPLTIVFAIALVLGVAIPLAIYQHATLLTIAGTCAAFAAGASALIDPISRWRKGLKVSPSILGMSVAHLGLAVFVLGATITRSYEADRDVGLAPGESAKLGPYDFKFNGTKDVEGPNFSAIQGEVVVSQDGNQIAVLHPQKRMYRVQQNTMTEAGLVAGWHRDLLVAMGEPLSRGTGNESWSMRLQYRPLVRFVWLGVILMSIGGLIAAIDRRYRTVKVTEGAAVAGAPAVG